jgi:hypothetical protein
MEICVGTCGIHRCDFCSDPSAVSSSQPRVIARRFSSEGQPQTVRGRNGPSNTAWSRRARSPCLRVTRARDLGRALTDEGFVLGRPDLKLAIMLLGNSARFRQVKPNSSWTQNGRTRCPEDHLL